jgi:hypothetical protein
MYVLMITYFAINRAVQFVAMTLWLVAKSFACLVLTSFTTAVLCPGWNQKELAQFVDLS